MDNPWGPIDIVSNLRVSASGSQQTLLGTRATVEKPSETLHELAQAVAADPGAHDDRGL